MFFETALASKTTPRPSSHEASEQAAEDPGGVPACNAEVGRPSVGD